MTPMIDVVFLLIIFFLVSNHLARREAQLELQLPVAKSGDEDVTLSQPRITINARSDGSLMFAGRETTVDEIPARLAAAKNELGDDFELRLRSSRQTPYGKIEPVMTACTRLGIWNVTFAVYREDR